MTFETINISTKLEILIGTGDYIAFTLPEPVTAGKYIDGLQHSISQLSFFLLNFYLFRILFYKIRKNKKSLEII